MALVYFYWQGPDGESKIELPTSGPVGLVYPTKNYNKKKTNELFTINLNVNFFFIGLFQKKLYPPGISSSFLHDPLDFPAIFHFFCIRPPGNSQFFSGKAQIFNQILALRYGEWVNL